MEQSVVIEADTADFKKWIAEYIRCMTEGEPIEVRSFYDRMPTPILRQQRIKMTLPGSGMVAVITKVVLHNSNNTAEIFF